MSLDAFSGSAVIGKEASAAARGLVMGWWGDAVLIFLMTALV